MGGRSVAVIGLGNVLMGDDAFGPYVVRVLQARYAFPAGVEVAELGTPGLDLTPYLAGLDALVVVDTVKSSGAPGDLRLYRKAEILRQPPAPRLSPHDPSLKNALLTAEFAGYGPAEVLLVGAIPESVAMGVELRPRMRVAVDAAVAEVLRELARLGLATQPAARPRPADIWWEHRSAG
jgi:hydrogenase maturation protease